MAALSFGTGGSSHAFALRITIPVGLVGLGPDCCALAGPFSNLTYAAGRNSAAASEEIVGARQSLPSCCSLGVRAGIGDLLVGAPHLVTVIGAA